MIGRALVIWLAFLALAIAAAALREGLLTPRVGESAAHRLGTAAVVAAFLVVIGLSVRWIVPSLESGRLLGLGLFWTVLTITFEFAFGRFVVGHSWRRLLHDYNLLAGRVWILVLLTTLLGPWLVGGVLRGS